MPANIAVTWGKRQPMSSDGGICEATLAAHAAPDVSCCAPVTSS